MDSKILVNPMENEEYINIAVMKNKVDLSYDAQDKLSTTLQEYAKNPSY